MPDQREPLVDRQGFLSAEHRRSHLVSLLHTLRCWSALLAALRAECRTPRVSPDPNPAFSSSRVACSWRSLRQSHALHLAGHPSDSRRETYQYFRTTTRPQPPSPEHQEYFLAASAA